MAKENDELDFSMLDEELDFSMLDDSQEESADDVSLSETALRGAIQGGTFDFGDELGAAALAPLASLESMIPGTPANVDKQLREQGFSGEGIREQDLLDKYKELRDVTRAENTAAREANPYTYMAADIAGGIAPALASGGASAVGGLGTALTKGGLTAAAKQSAKRGAKYGAVSGLGRSEEDAIEGLVKDTAKGAGMGAVLGSVTPGVIKAGSAALGKVKSLIGSGVTKTVNAVEIIPVIKDGIESFRLTRVGKGVVGEKNYQEIINQSKDLIKNKLKPFLVSEDLKFANAIGKVYKRIGSLGSKKDVSKELHDIEKYVFNLSKSGKVPTEEGKKVLQELSNTISQFKTDLIQVIPTKNVNTGVQNAIKSLDTKVNKLKVIGEEAGERVKFTEPKIDLEKGTISVFETSTGRVITTPIRSGEFTPIKYDTSKSYKDLDINELRGLKDSAFELLEKAKKGGAGVAQKPIARTYGKIKDSIGDMASESGMQPPLNIANKGMSQIRGLDKLLPKSLLKDKDGTAVYKVAQFLRKAEVEGISGDELRDKLVHFSDDLSKLSPKFANKFLVESNEIARRYELARTAKQTFGINLGTAKAMSTLGGAGIGKITKGADKVVKNIANTANNIANIPKDALMASSESLMKSSNKGLSAMGKQLQTALSHEDATVQNAMIWSLSQNPAFRKATEDFIKDRDAEEASFIQGNNILGDLDGTKNNVDDTSSIQPRDNPGADIANAKMLEGKNLETVKATLAARESSNDPTVINEKGYVGKYQFGAQALETLGYLKPGSYKKYKNGALKRPELFTGKDGVDSLDTFLSDEAVQDSIMDSNLEHSYKYLKDHGIDVENMAPEEVAGALSAAHLVGAKGTTKFIKDGVDSEDANGTKASDYYNLGRDSVLNTTNDNTEDTVEEGEEDNDPVEAGGESSVETAKKSVSSLAKQMGSGDDISEFHMENLLGELAQLNTSEDNIDALQDEAMKMETFSDAEKLKRLLDGLKMA